MHDSCSWVAITRRRSCSQTSGVLVPAAKEPIWTATYQKKQVHNFLIYISIIHLYTYTLVDRHFLPDTQDIPPHPTEVIFACSRTKTTAICCFCRNPRIIRLKKLKTMRYLFDTTSSSLWTCLLLSRLRGFSSWAFFLCQIKFSVAGVRILLRLVIASSTCGWSTDWHPPTRMNIPQKKQDLSMAGHLMVSILSYNIKLFPPGHSRIL